MPNPKQCLVTKVYYVDNHDGDTITFEMRRRFPIRLLDIDTPELKEHLGTEARDFVKSELSVAKEIVVEIPTEDSLKLMDINSFGRLLGNVWYDGKNLKEELLKRGFVK